MTSPAGTQPTILDVAAYIVSRRSNLSTSGLQKLCFIAQGWHLALIGRPLFNDQFEAWTSGPVNRDLFEEYRGQHLVTVVGAGNPYVLSLENESIVLTVIEKFAHLSGIDLAEITMRCDAWGRARVGVGQGAPATVMDNDLIRDYYVRQMAQR